MAVVSDVEIRLRADIARLQRDMTQVRRSVDNAMGGVTRAAEQAKFALMSLGAGIGLGGVGRMIDEYQKYSAQLKLATRSQREFAVANEDVKRIATQSTQGLQQTGVLYARIANGTRELGVAQSQVAAITETVNLALLISGATADEAASAQLQLSQAFASGTLRGEEFNAVNEAAPRLMLALADGIGVPVGALKKMAEEGAITSKIMADVLPNALGKLRDEAAQVQTIAGAFTVLRNNVMEFVGVQAQANGVVAGISGGVMLLAQNLGLVAGAIATVTGARLLGWLSGIAGGTVTATAANRAFLVSNLEVATAEATATAQASALAGVRLAEVRAATLAATGNVQLALTTNALIPAQTRAAAAAAAHEITMNRLTAAQRAASLSSAALATASTTLNRVLALTGGPLGLLVTVLGIAALAWSHYGDKAKEANDKAKGETEKSTREIVDGLNAQNDKLRERLELQKKIGKDAVQNGGEGVERQAALYKQIIDLQDSVNRGTGGTNGSTRLIELQYEYTDLANSMEKVAGTQKELADGTRAQALSAWFGQNGTKTQKMVAELEELRKKFGEIPPEMENLVRAKYAEKDIGANAVKQATKAAQEFIETLKEQAQAVGITEEQQRMLTAAQAAAKAPSAALRLEIMQQAVVTNEAIKANEAAIESQKAYAKMQENSGKLEQEMADGRADAIKSATDEAEKNEQLAKTFGMTAAQVAALELARLKEQLAARSSVGMTLDEIEHLENLIALKERSAAAVASTQAMEESKQFWIDIDKTAHDTFVSIADGGKNAFQRLKDTAKNVFFDWLYQQTIKKWIVNIQANTSTSGASGIASLFGGSSDSGAGGGLSSISSLISMGKTIYSGFSGGIASTLGGYASSAGSLFGSTAMSSFGAGLSSPGTAAIMGELASGAAGATSGTAAAGSAAAGASAGAYAIPIAGWIAAGMALSKNLYSSGWQADNGSMNTLGNVVSSGSKILDSALRGIGLSKSTANMFSGMSTYVKLFGRKNPEVTSQGIEGTFGTGGFTGQAFADILEKGGWFRSDKNYTKTAALGSEQENAFDTTMTSMITAVKGFGDALGAQTSVIDGYSKQVKLTLTEDQAANEKLIAETFGQIGDELALRLIPTIAQFSQTSETAAATLQRITMNFQVIDGVLAAMGTDSQTAFRAVGVASIEARERLVTLAGGLDTLGAQVDFFTQNFLTRAEQIAPLQKQVNDQLAALGYAGLTTADQFKTAVLGLAQSGALATEVGAKTYAGLLAVAPGFKTVADYLAEIAGGSGLEALRTRADDAMSVLSRSVDAQKDVVANAYDAAMAQLETSLDGVNEAIGRNSALSQALRGAVRGVDSPEQQAASRLAAGAQIATALAIAKASGVLPSADDLRDALSTIGADNGDQFATLAEYQRSTARMNSQLEQLGGLTDDQLSTAERQLQALQEQRDVARAANETELARLDGLLTYGQAQLDAANGINNSVLSVGTAMNEVLFAVRDLKAASGGFVGQLTGYAPPLAGPVSSGVPMVASVPQSGTMGGSAAAMQSVLEKVEQRLASIETTNAQTAQASVQFAGQFNSVSAGGNSLLIEQMA